VCRAYLYVPYSASVDVVADTRRNRLQGTRTCALSLTILFISTAMAEAALAKVEAEENQKRALGLTRDPVTANGNRFVHGGPCASCHHSDDQ
jgi:hypothetical protein